MSFFIIIITLVITYSKYYFLHSIQFYSILLYIIWMCILLNLNIIKYNIIFEVHTKLSDCYFFILIIYFRLYREGKAISISFLFNFICADDLHTIEL